MRPDGRLNEEMRLCRIITGYVPWCSGSVVIDFGNTSVICNASITSDVPGHRIALQEGWITAEYAMLPCAGFQRSPRDGRPKINGRTHEIQRMIGRSLRSGIDLKKIPGCTIQIDCDVLKADGGTRTASITGAWVALRCALFKHFNGDIPDGLFKAEYIAAISTGVVCGVPVLDLAYEEDSIADVDMNLVLSSSGEWIEIQATAERHPQSPELLARLFTLASDGISQLWNIQKSALTQVISL